MAFEDWIRKGHPSKLCLPVQSPSETSRSRVRMAYSFQYNRGTFVATSKLHSHSTVL
jgi:hypothetical protein